QQECLKSHGIAVKDEAIQELAVGLVLGPLRAGHEAQEVQHLAHPPGCHACFSAVVGPRQMIIASLEANKSEIERKLTWATPGRYPPRQGPVSAGAASPSPSGSEDEITPG